MSPFAPFSVRLGSVTETRYTWVSAVRHTRCDPIVASSTADDQPSGKPESIPTKTTPRPRPA